MLHGARDARSLEQWCRDYLAVDGVSYIEEEMILAEVERDHLDRELIEQQVVKAVGATNVSQGFCSRCRDLFRSFPSPEGEHRAADWMDCVADIDAGARRGCRLCCLIFTCLGAEDKLDLWYKIEGRLSNGGVSPPSPTIAADFDVLDHLRFFPPGMRVRKYTQSAVQLTSTPVLPSRRCLWWLLRPSIALTWF